MNYGKIYDDLMMKAKNRNWSRKTAPCYVEQHHIIPKSIGGKRLKDNLVLLTGKEHYLAHLLLIKIHENDPIKKKSMVAAWMYMAGIAVHTPDGKERRTGKLYEKYRAELSKAYSGKNNPMFGKTTSDKQKETIRKLRLGKKDSPETTERRRLAQIGRKHTEVSKEKNRQWHLGRKASKETKAKIAKALTGRVPTQEHREKVSAALSKGWIITMPDGTQKQIKNLREFCRDNNIDAGNLSKYGKSKGFRAVKA